MKQNGSRERVWMSRAEVAGLLEVSPATIGRWASQGKLPHAETLGGRRRYRRADVVQLVARVAKVTRATRRPRAHP